MLDVVACCDEKRAFFCMPGAAMAIDVGYAAFREGVVIIATSHAEAVTVGVKRDKWHKYQFNICRR